MAWKHIASFRIVPASHVVDGIAMTAATATATATSFHTTPLCSAARIQFHVIQGSVVDFCPTDTSAGLPRLQRRAAIVNAANQECLGGGGVDGAITQAGGPNLARDRKALPHVPLKKRIRCPTGQARITGPGEYGTLHVPYVIHAVGPNYWNYDNGNQHDIVNHHDHRYHNDDNEFDNANDVEWSAKYQQGHALLRSAYFSSLDYAQHHQLKQIAFPLLSAGVYRGQVPLSLVLRIGVQAIQDWVLHHHSLEQQHHHQQQEQHQQERQYRDERSLADFVSLECIYICGFTAIEAQAVLDVCEELKLHRVHVETNHS